MRPIDFVGIGFPKSGTTWLSNMLELHPEVNLAKHKETSFFMGDSYAEVIRSFYPRFFKIESREEFEREFIHNKDLIKGEFSPHYVYDVESIKNIQKHSDKVKIIICIRNSADFVYSYYWYLRGSNLSYRIPSDFLQAFNSIKYLRDLGFIYKNLKPWLETYSEDKVYLVNFEDIVRNPGDLLINIYKFLGIFEKVNFQNRADLKYRTKRLRSERLAWLINPISERLARGGLSRFINSKYFYNLYTKINKQDFKYPEMRVEERKFLSEFYKQDIEQLKRII